MFCKKQEFKREPFQFTARAMWEEGKEVTDVPFDVPLDSRLVIENISATIECPIEEEIMTTQVRTSVNNVVAWHSVYVPKTAAAAVPNERFNLYCGGQQVRLYADPGTTVNVLVHKNGGYCQTPPHCGTTLVFISGYLLPVESPRLAP